MLQVGGGAVRQIAEVLGQVRPVASAGGDRPVHGLVAPRAALPGAARRRRHRRHRVQRHRARPDRHGDRSRRCRTQPRQLRLPDRLRRRLADRHREGDGDPRRRWRQDARLQGAGAGRSRRAAGDRHPHHRRHRQRVHALHRHHRHRTRREDADRRPRRAAAGGDRRLRTDLQRAAAHHRRYRRGQPDPRAGGVRLQACQSVLRCAGRLRDGADRPAHPHRLCRTAQRRGARGHDAGRDAGRPRVLQHLGRAGARHVAADRRAFPRAARPVERHAAAGDHAVFRRGRGGALRRGRTPHRFRRRSRCRCGGGGQAGRRPRNAEQGAFRAEPRRVRHRRERRGTARWR